MLSVLRQFCFALSTSENPGRLSGGFAPYSNSDRKFPPGIKGRIPPTLARLLLLLFGELASVSFQESGSRYARKGHGPREPLDQLLPLWNI